MRIEQRRMRFERDTSVFEHKQTRVYRHVRGWIHVYSGERVLTDKRTREMLYDAEHVRDTEQCRGVYIERRGVPRCRRANMRRDKLHKQLAGVGDVCIVAD